MDLGFIGLGKMGLNMVKRLVKGGHRVFATDRTTAKKSEAEQAGAVWVENSESFKTILPSPRIVWLMVPAGQATAELLNELSQKLDSGDILIDGGNSDYRDSVRRAAAIEGKGIRFIDCGTSGGVWGLKNGYCLMIGANDKSAVDYSAPVFGALAPPQGWLHVGPAGHGHYVKMVHNAIEYGMMQAYAEGFELLQNHCGKMLNLAEVAHLWNQGSVVRSWLLELSENVFNNMQELDELKGRVEDSGECRWALETAVSEGIPTPVFAAALFNRFASKRENAFGNRYLAALRNQFGGHAVTKKQTNE